MTSKQIIKKVWEFLYNKESRINKYMKVITNDNKVYNCIDLEIYPKYIESGNNIINYTDIKNIVLM